MDSHYYLIRHDHLLPFLSFTTPSAAGTAIPRFQTSALSVVFPYHVTRSPSPQRANQLGAKHFHNPRPRRTRTTRDATLRRDAINRPTTMM